MQKLTDLKGFQRRCFKLLRGWFFFFSQSVLFYFEVATFSSIALRVFACALRLSLFVASRSQWGIQEAGCSAQGVQGAERQKQNQRWLWVGRRLKHIKARSQREEGGHCASDWLPRGGHLCTEWQYTCLPALFLGDKHNKYYSLHTVYSSGHQPPHTGSSLWLCSYLARRVRVRARICF